MVTRIDKAIVAGLIMAVGVLVKAQTDGVAIDLTMWVQALVAGLIAAAGVWLVPNKPAPV